MKQFATAARRGAGAVPKSVDVDFEFEDRDGHFVEMTAHPPTSGQLALFLADQGLGGAASVRALFDFMASVLDQKDYDVIEAKLRDGLDVQVVVEIIEYLTEEWGARPTQPASVSLPSPSNNGKRSTEKRRPKESTS